MHTVQTHAATQSFVALNHKHEEEVIERRMPLLIDWLLKAAKRKGDSKAELACHLGVNYGYLHQLHTGQRQIENISPDFCRQCARYLDIPPVAVMVAAGRIQMSDFLMPEVSRTPVNQLIEGLERIAADPLVGCLMPSEVWDVPDSVKALLIALYEDSTQQELFPARELPMIFRGLQDAALQMAHIEVDAEAEFQQEKA